jgi:uncharacterized protein (DUF2252 family)
MAPGKSLIRKPLPTCEERRAYGESRREVVHRVDQGKWAPAPNRQDPIAAILATTSGRLPELVPIRMGRMVASLFGFFRGAADIMAADLAPWPTSGLQVQSCGDAHVRNLGAFAAPDGHLVFDLNDFDETIRGPWEWDLKRLATSILLAGREAGEKERDCYDAILALVSSYRGAMIRFLEMTALDLVKYEARRHSQVALVRAVLAKAERATPQHTLEKLTVATRGGWRRFAQQPPLLKHVPDEVAESVLAALAPYRETLGPDHQQVLDAYQPFDVAFKVVGTGSVGVRDYVVLCFGNGPEDPLFLQVKEEGASCYVPYLREVPPFSHQGRRVAEGQHRMQTLSDPFLGWTSIDGRDYLVRQLCDHKASIDPMDLKGEALNEYGLVCGEILAKGHARTGDAAAIAGYCGGNDKLDKAIAQFAVAYAEQTSRDHEALEKAIKAGAVKAVRGV